MSRTSKKKPAVSMAVLEHLPAIREAFAHLGLEVVVRPRGIQAPGQTSTVPVPNRDGPVNLETPERMEWVQQQQEVAQALEQERKLAAPPVQPKPLDKLPAAQRRAIQAGFMMEAQAKKAELLAKFKHDSPNGAEVDEVTKQELTTLSEAT